MSWINLVYGKSRRHCVKRNWRQATKGMRVVVSWAVFLTSTQGGIKSRFRYSQTRVCQEDLNAKRIVTTVTLCSITAGKTYSLLNALSDSATSAEAEARLLMLMRCFLAIRIEGLSNASL